MLDDCNAIVGGFAMVPNYCLRDKRLKPADKGIYAYICSNASTFKCSEKRFAKNLGIGITAVKNSLKRLFELGYIYRVEVRDEKGKFSHITYVARAIPENLDKGQETTTTDEPLLDNPLIENPTPLIILGINTISETTLKGITPYELTTNQELFEKRLMRRNLTLSETAIWRSWQKNGVDPYLILRAYVDTEYKGRKQTLQDIDNALKAWKEFGAESYKDVENYILNRMRENIIKKLKYEQHCTDDEIETALLKTESGFITGWRDDIRKAYNTRQYEEAQYMLHDCPDEVFRYLSDDLLEFAADYYERKGMLDKKATCLSFVEGGKAYA
ncbi:MAG: helix-turn-helix domain-containing protein [Clostridia bacterium]|nr:helix-turn-helix domain-containing protein [Clostridia bacterium]